MLAGAVEVDGWLHWWAWEALEEEVDEVGAAVEVWLMVGTRAGWWWWWWPCRLLLLLLMLLLLVAWPCCSRGTLDRVLGFDLSTAIGMFEF